MEGGGLCCRVIFLDSRTIPKSTATNSNTSSLFSALPQLKPTSNLSSSQPNAKRVVQFKPPINPFLSGIDEEDDDEEELAKKRKQRKELESSSETSWGGPIIDYAYAKNSVTLGALPSSGSGSRAIVEIEVSASASSSEEEEEA
uniref:Uncharacterized protein n=1 Tax=Cannabis sativa TaxID=3483 RepID=A0A803PBK0_CANSA